MEARSVTYQPTPGEARLLSPLRVVALGLVAAAAGLAAWQFREESREGRVPLLADTLLPSSELALMEAAFDRAQLTDYTIDGGQILVPKGRQSGYMRALVDAEALPREFGGSLRRAMETSSPWQSRAVQDERLRIATQEELSLVLCSMPGIRRAAVLYDAEARASMGPGRALGSGPRQTASVNIETDEDAAIDRVRARSIRVLVAASIAGLAPEDVAVTDLRSGLVYAGPLEPATADVSDTEAVRIALEERLAERIRRSLAYVQGAIVDVRADVGTPLAAAAPPTISPQKASDANAPADVRKGFAAPAAPPVATRLADGRQVVAVHVAVALPQSSAIGSDDAIRQHVLELLPATANPTASSVKVTRFRVGTAPQTPHDTLTAAADAAPRPLPLPFAEDAGGDSAGAPLTAEELLAQARQTLQSLPQEVWMTGLATAVVGLAGLLWWRGGRPQRPADGDAMIDWTQHAPRTPSTANDAGAVGTAPRAAAALLVLTLACSSTSRADEPPAVLTPSPLETPVLLVEPTDATPAEGRGSEADAADGFGRTAAAGDEVTGASRYEVTAAVTMAAAVLALVALSWFGKKQPAAVPRDVFEVLGSGQLDRGQRVAVVRFGPKTLLVSVGSAGCSTLSEIDDPKATDTIAHACRHVGVAGRVRKSLPPAASPATPATPRPLESAA